MKNYSLFIIIIPLSFLILFGFLYWRGEEKKSEEKFIKNQISQSETEKIQDAIEKNKSLQVVPLYKFKFEDYLINVNDVNSDVHASLNLKSHPKGLRFKTVITDAYKEGPNFAGHYTIIGWGNGIPETDYVIVDNLTGNILDIFITTINGVDFRLDSRLLVVNPNNIVDNCIEVDNFMCFDTEYYELIESSSKINKIKEGQ